MDHHSACHDDHVHSHDHDHDHDHSQGSDLGPQDNLFAHIDRENVVALNSADPGSLVIKPWHERTEETKFIQSDADDQLIIRVPFTGSVRLRSIILKTGPTDETPSRVSLFTNNPNLDFDDINEATSSQEIEIPQGREPFEYAIKPAKFSNVSSITLYFPSSQGAETVKIYYLGFLGQHFERKNNPVITVYESQANLADHTKIQGTDGNFSTPQT